VEASEAIRVTEKGSELFYNFSRDLHIKWPIKGLINISTNVLNIPYVKK
jgi:hypothetical protein